jgi:hypothetical protein
MNCKVSLIILAMFMTGCGWFSRGADYPEGEPEITPVEVIDESTLIYYSPDTFAEGVPVKGTDEKNFGNPEVCEYNLVSYELEPYSIDDEFIEFVYDTQSGNRTYSVGVNLLDTEHIFMKGMTLTVNRDNFDFLVWIKADVQGNGEEPARIAWGGPFDVGAKTIALDVKGATDLRPYISYDKREMSFRYTFRAKSPDNPVKLVAVLEYMTLSNCEQVE